MLIWYTTFCIVWREPKLIQWTFCMLFLPCRPLRLLIFVLCLFLVIWWKINVSVPHFVLRTVCASGYGYTVINVNLTLCLMCEVGQYKSTVSNDPCSTCAADSSTSGPGASQCCKLQENSLSLSELYSSIDLLDCSSFIFIPLRFYLILVFLEKPLPQFED